MKVESIKDTIFKKGIKAIPNVIWVICASYALIMFTNLIVLKFSDIDADKHINRYLDIVLSEKEAGKECEIDYSLTNQANQNTQLILELALEVDILKENSHAPAK